ncbi:hypothetical protein [uncultured Pseudodesulfovibrio sp.]|uniref:hypothetical protein n=1 Tax=uncultured Pseudodesulfovibrio sp. TaxID=2035858 RepID=UPI0029C759B6|nr:hypothetical protein [uncultured Pseudodesulfovibrio sp.]
MKKVVLIMAILSLLGCVDNQKNEPEFAYIIKRHKSNIPDELKTEIEILREKVRKAKENFDPEEYLEELRSPWRKE